MTELIEHTEFEQHLRSTLGVMLMKPDALEVGIVEELIDYTYTRLQTIVPNIELAGAILIPSFNEAEVEKIYPDLEDKYRDAFKIFYKQGPLVAVFWSSDSTPQDLWIILKTLRGKITEGFGLNDSIRSIIPLPGNRERYEEITKKIESEELNSDDYIELCRSLVHIPENIKEFAGLFLSIDQSEIIDVFGSDKAKELTTNLSGYMS